MFFFSNVGSYFTYVNLAGGRVVLVWRTIFVSRNFECNHMHSRFLHEIALWTGQSYFGFRELILVNLNLIRRYPHTCIDTILPITVYRQEK